MKMKFTRKDEYSDLVGGVINYGSGAFNIATDLPENGVFETEDPRLQHVLGEYRGEHGRVFDVEVYQPDGTTAPAELEQAPAQPPPRSPAEAVAEKMAGRTGAAEHGPEEGYALLSEGELMDILRGKNIQFNPNASKDELVKLIEADDAKGA